MNLEMVGVGATAKIYRDGDVAIKLYQNSSLFEVEQEAKLQTLAFETGLLVPEILGVKQMGESQIALEMKYIAGIPLASEEMEQAEIVQQIGMLVKLQCEIHAKDASEFPNQNDRLRMQIKQNSLIDDEMKNQLFAMLEQLDAGATQLCHGDFHPLNVLFDGKEHWVIDWVCATSGNPLADVCRSYILLQQFAPQLAALYLRLFCKETDISSEKILVWLPLIIAARLAEDVDADGREMLLGMLGEIM